MSEIEYIKSRHHGFEMIHPSFGAIRVNKVHGLNKNMFGTNVDHDAFIELTIAHADGRLDGALDQHYMHSKPIVTVQMTAMQWAELVSSFGNGMGVKCTIADENGKRIQKPTTVKKLNENFSETVNDSVDRCIDASIYEVRDILNSHIKNGTKAGKKEMEELVRKLGVANNIKNNIKYAVEEINKMAEKIIKEAELTADAKISLFKESIANNLLGIEINDNLLISEKPSSENE